MFRISDEEIVNALQPHLQPGEPLRNYAIGYQLPLWQQLLGPLFLVLLSKFYMVALTDRRLLLVRFKEKVHKIKSVKEYRLSQITNIRTKTGLLHTFLTVEVPNESFSCKFHRNTVRNNRPKALALVATLEQRGGSFHPAAEPAPAPAPVAPRVNGMALRMGQVRIPLSVDTRLNEQQIVGLLSQAQNDVVAVVEGSPNDSSILGLKNLSTSPWVVTLPGGENREVAAGRTIRLIDGARFSFGFCEGIVEGS
jgi:hypothetical protein